MEYGSLLSRAWQITWKHKILWLFGILAGFGSTNFNGNFGGGGGGRNVPSTPGTPPTPTVPPTFPDISPQLANGQLVAILAVIGCCLLIIVIALVIIGIIARGGLIGGIRMADEQDHVTFGEAWAIGTHYFWRMFGIGLLLIAPTIVLVIVFATVGILTAGVGVLCLLPLLCILVPLFIVLAILAHFAQFAVVLEDMRVMDAFRRGWQILKANLSNIIILGIILIIIEFIAGLVLVVPFLVILIPTVLFAFATSSGGQPNLSALAVGGLAFLCFLPIAIVLGGILHTWVTAVWTLAYKQFVGRTPMAAVGLGPVSPVTPAA
jgi:hypothetical protein